MHTWCEQDLGASKTWCEQKAWCEQKVCILRNTYQDFILDGEQKACIFETTYQAYTLDCEQKACIFRTTTYQALYRLQLLQCLRTRDPSSLSAYGIGNDAHLINHRLLLAMPSKCSPS